jgi:hypothetical protein
LQHEDLEDDPGIWGGESTAWNLETVAKDCIVVARKHQMILKLMEDQLHINWDTDHQTVYADSGKEKYLYVVCSTQSYWWAKGAQSYSLWKIHCSMLEISHPPYSPILNPANFFTITKVKVTFKGRFQDSEDVKNITTKRSVL